ncbi:MAG: histidine kinase, partial [Caulobacter sp.]|nr:histidine kinase [Caulobacter sp.]
MAAQNSSPEDVALSLTLAVVASSPGPLLLLDGDLAIVAASTSFCETFDARRADLMGLRLYAVGAGEWDTSQLRSLMAATVSGGAQITAYEMDLERPRRPVRQLIVQARRLTYLDLDQTRLLVAVSDVT